MTEPGLKRQTQEPWFPRPTTGAGAGSWAEASARLALSAARCPPALSHRQMLWLFSVGSVASVGLEPTTVGPRVTRSTERPKGPLSHHILRWILGWAGCWLPSGSVQRAHSRLPGHREADPNPGVLTISSLRQPLKPWPSPFLGLTCVAIGELAVSVPSRGSLSGVAPALGHPRKSGEGPAGCHSGPLL